MVETFTACYFSSLGVLKQNWTKKAKNNKKSKEKTLKKSRNLQIKKPSVEVKQIIITFATIKCKLSQQIFY